MRVPADIMGERFGRLVAVECLGRDAGGRMIWHCVCDCGGGKTATTGNLRNGFVRSCGCLPVGRRAIDLTGSRYGKLLALERVGSAPRGGATWLCACDCGGTATLSAEQLRLRGWRSCGCVPRCPGRPKGGAAA